MKKRHSNLRECSYSRCGAPGAVLPLDAIPHRAGEMYSNLEEASLLCLFGTNFRNTGINEQWCRHNDVKMKQKARQGDRLELKKLILAQPQPSSF